MENQSPHMQCLMENPVVDMLSGRGIPLIENEKVPKFVDVLVSPCLVYRFLGFLVSNFQRFKNPFHVLGKS